VVCAHLLYLFSSFLNESDEEAEKEQIILSYSLVGVAIITVSVRVEM